MDGLWPVERARSSSNGRVNGEDKGRVMCVGGDENQCVVRWGATERKRGGMERPIMHEIALLRA